MPDLSGHKFGRWLVLHKDLDRLDHKGIKSYYICQCDCGSIHSVSAYGLRNGTSKSCGCKTKDRITKYIYSISSVSNLLFSGSPFTVFRRIISVYIFSINSKPFLITTIQSPINKRLRIIFPFFTDTYSPASIIFIA